MKAELALFHPGAKEKAIEEVFWINHRPVSQISNNSAIEFNISGTSSDYVLLSKTRLHLKVRLLKEDGTYVTANDNVALVNLSHSLFRQCDISLNQKLVTSSVGVNYPYKAIFDVLIGYNHDVKDSLLFCENYAKDTGYFMSDTTLNGGHLQRKTLTKSGVADFESVLHMDVCQQPKAILNGVQITVRLFQSDDSFRLLSANGVKYSVEIQDAILKVCNVRVRPSVLVAQNELLLKTPAVYPFWKSDVKTFGIPQGSYTFSVDDIFQGEVPSRLIVALTPSAGYAGDFSKNPFDFQHYYLNFLELAVDGQSVPTVAFQPHYQDDPEPPHRMLPTGYVHEFLSLFKSRYPQAQGNWIQRADYAGGYAIYIFDLKSGINQNLFSINKKGHTRLTARFERELPEPVTAIAYGIFPSQFQIDHARNVLT